MSTSPSSSNSVGFSRRYESAERLQTKFRSNRSYLDAQMDISKAIIRTLGMICATGTIQDFRDFLVLYYPLFLAPVALGILILKNRYDLLQKFVQFIPCRSFINSSIQAVEFGSVKLYPIHLAARNSDPRFVELLLQQGASLTTDRHITPLIEAIPNEATFKFILERSSAAELEVRDFRERTLTHLAVVINSISTVELLLRSGCDHLRLIDSNGDTPFHLATRCGHIDMMIALYRAGYRDLTVGNPRTPFELAFHNLRPIETASVLIALGVSIPSNLTAVLKFGRAHGLRTTASELRKMLQVSDADRLRIRFHAYFVTPLVIQLLNGLNSMDRLSAHRRFEIDL